MPREVSLLVLHSQHTMKLRDCEKDVRHVLNPSALLFEITDTQFEWDFSVALLLPVMMSLSIASSLDPWVGGRRGGAGLGWAALEAFPRGSSLLKQVGENRTPMPVHFSFSHSKCRGGGVTLSVRPLNWE